MAEYIERQAVLNLPQSITRNFVGEVVERSIDIEDIKDLPAADVAPVVRCEECKHHSFDAGYGNYWCNLTSGVRKVKRLDFCSYGERREE